MYEQYYKEFMNKFYYLSDRYGKYKVFFDFLKLISFSMYNSFVRSPDIENKYLKIVSCYPREDINVFCEMFSKLILMYETKGGVTDILGEIYMGEKIGNSNFSQIFTPFHISEFMARILCGTKEKMQSIINKNGYIVLSEACAGAGTMILAFAKTLQDENINYQQNLLVHAIDISEICTYMTYVQLSFYGIPAIVFCGDAISQKMNFKLETPLYFINYWKFGKPQNIGNNEIEEKEKINNITNFKEVTKNGICQISFW